MHRHLQFGMRENPASDRRHDSRLAVSPESHSHFVGKESAETGSTIAVADPGFVDADSSTNAATKPAATLGKPEANNEPVSAGSWPVQVPLNTHSHTQIEFEPLLDVIDAAKLLRIHPKTLRAKAGRGIIPGIQIGRVWRFRASMLNRWLEGMTDRGRKQKSQ